MISDTVVLSTNDTSTIQKIYSFSTVAKPITNLQFIARGSSLDSYTIIYFKTFSIQNIKPKLSDSYLTMLASENILRRDWDQPEEDEAWADL